MADRYVEEGGRASALNVERRERGRWVREKDERPWPVRFITTSTSVLARGEMAAVCAVLAARRRLLSRLGLLGSGSGPLGLSARDVTFNFVASRVRPVPRAESTL